MTFWIPSRPGCKRAPLNVLGVHNLTHTNDNIATAGSYNFSANFGLSPTAIVDDLERPSRNLATKPLILNQRLPNIHASCDPLLLEPNNSIRGIQGALLHGTKPDNSGTFTAGVASMVGLV